MLAWQAEAFQQEIEQHVQFQNSKECQGTSSSSFAFKKIKALDELIVFSVANKQN